MYKHVAAIPSGDASRFAWSALGQFQNVSHVESMLMRRHSIDDKYKKNATKQARQIRYCLIQAQEYFSAAKFVQMPTRPLLLYYGVMSLALAEILLKGSGEVSLDRARVGHAHHGLTLSVNGDPSKISQLGASAASLIAKPVRESRGNRFGTFELWHRGCREPPIAGANTLKMNGQVTQSAREILLGAGEERLPEVPDAGVSLISCFRSHPLMIPVLYRSGDCPSLTRATINREIDSRGMMTYKFIFQPDQHGHLHRCYDLVKCDPAAVDLINVHEMDNGCVLSWKVREFEEFYMSFPMAFQSNSREFYHLVDINCLNEFGVLYTGIYIMGNYARYYPDQWMMDVESSSDLFLACKEFTEIVESRAPILTLSEFADVVFLED